MLPVLEKIDSNIADVAVLLRESKMPSEVRGLSEMMRNAKTQLARARKSIEALSATAADTSAILDQVEATTAELKAANQELRNELHGTTNGGPPLEAGNAVPAPDNVLGVRIVPTTSRLGPPEQSISVSGPPPSIGFRANH